MNTQYIVQCKTSKDARQLLEKTIETLVGYCEVMRVDTKKLVFTNERASWRFISIHHPDPSIYDGFRGKVISQETFEQVLKIQKQGATKMPNELKPCPFCGGTDLELQDFTDRIYGFWDYRIKCKTCRAFMNSPSTATVEFTNKEIRQTRNDETKAKAKRELIIAWNRRAE